jgi:hypothetical protein
LFLEIVLFFSHLSLYVARARSAPALRLVASPVELPSPSSGKGWIEPVLAFVLFLAVAAALQFKSPLVADPDSLYHFAHAQIYGSRGIVDQSFPWTSASAIGHLNGDLWWGFHVLTIPFTWMGTPLVGLKLAAAAFLAGGMFFLYLACRPLDRKWAFAAPVIVLFAGSLELDRLLALRPQSLSIGLFALAVMLVCRDRWKWGLVVGLWIGYVHETLAWLACFLVLVTAIVCSVEGKKVQFKAPLATVLGVCLAAFLRPGAVDALRLMKIQLIDLGQAKSADIPMKFGVEVQIMPLDQLGQNFWLFTVLWVGSLFYLVYRLRTGSIAAGFERKLVISTAVISLVGFEISTVSSLRGVEVWVAFGSIPIISALASLAVLRERKALLVPSMAVLSLAFVMLSLPTHLQNYRSAVNVYRAKDAMDWIAQNSNDGDVVAHLYWDIFGDLIFNNKKNRYVEGMDPIFLYSQDPGLFWKMYYYESGQAVERTTATPPGTTPKWVDTHQFFSNDLNARYVLLVKGGTPELESYLRNDPGFSVGFEDYAFVVFRVAG